MRYFYLDMNSETPTPTPPASHKAKRPRSPSYPGIGLQEAIERARELYNAERQNAVPVDLVLQHFGYKPKSGAGSVVIAALKKFGLLDYQGSGDSRRARLTDAALDIILDTREDDSERRAAIQNAALLPTIHKELLAEYPDGLPSEASLRYNLTRERGFTLGAADELVRELHSTLEFAGLTDGGAILSRQAQDTSAEQEPEMTPPATAQAPSGDAPSQRVLRTPPAPQQRAVQLPVPGTSWVTVQGAFPLSAEAWDQMMALLEAMKPGLTTPE
jgi:hypothetical protein